MDDQELTRIFRALDAPAEADPAFGDTLFARLQSEASGARARRRSPALILLAAALVLSAVLGAGLAVGGGLVRLPWALIDASPNSSSSPIAAESATPQPSPNASPSVTPEASASASPGAGFAQGELVRATVDGLAVRAEPGTGAKRLGSLTTGMASYVVMGPSEADGYGWYLVSGLGLPPAADCPPAVETDPYNCPAWYGWVAGAALDGAPWLEIVEGDCPEPAAATLMELTLGRTGVQNLHCYASRQLVFRGWWPLEPSSAPACDAPSGIAWLRCPQAELGWDESYPSALWAAVDAEAGVAFPSPGQWIEITAHYNDPQSIDCASAADASSEDLRVILSCRSTLVITAVKASSAP
jgi:hypothetical protein